MKTYRIYTDKVEPIKLDPLVYWTDNDDSPWSGIIYTRKSDNKSVCLEIVEEEDLLSLPFEEVKKAVLAFDLDKLRKYEEQSYKINRTMYKSKYNKGEGYELGLDGYWYKAVKDVQ